MKYPPIFLAMALLLLQCGRLRLSIEQEQKREQGSGSGLRGPLTRGADWLNSGGNRGRYGPYKTHEIDTAQGSPGLSPDSSVFSRGGTACHHGEIR